MNLEFIVGPINIIPLANGLKSPSRWGVRYWLMENWPERILAITKQAEISKFSFSPTAAINPPWLMETVNEHLAHRKRDITQNDVLNAIRNLQDKREPVSKRAVRHFLGVSESKAIDSVLSRRNHARIDELITLLHKFEHQLATVSSSRDQQATLLRDYLIFILSILKQVAIEDICALSAGEVEQIISRPARADPTKLEIETALKERAKSLNAEYDSYARPKLLSGRPPASNWLIGREGKIFSGHTLRERIAKLMRKDFPEELWHSCDVFLLVEAGAALLKQAISKLDLSARSYHRILKVARTIADLAGAERIVLAHIAEAVQYRRFDKNQ